VPPITPIMTTGIDVMSHWTIKEQLEDIIEQSDRDHVRGE
jgi:hypothetical protein